MTGVSNNDTKNIQLRMADRTSEVSISSSVSEDDIREVVNGLLGNACEFKPYEGITKFVLQSQISKPG